MNEKYCLLIVDDEDLNHLFYQEILNPDRFIIEFASNGLEALEILNKQDNRIDLVLMDMKMPEMDGFTATEEIRKFNTTIPIIAQTAYAYRDDIDRAMDAGCSDYISKPIHEDVLIRKIEKLLKIS